MSLVVTFLSMLGQEAESGGVHRMLGVCSEFERIAKAVIDKAEKEQASKRKRKNQDAHESTSAKTAPTALPSSSLSASSASSSSSSSANAAAGKSAKAQDQPLSSSQPSSRSQSLAPASASSCLTSRPASSCSSATTAYQNTPSATPAEAAAAAATAAEIVNSHKMSNKRHNLHHLGNTSAAASMYGNSPMNAAAGMNGNAAGVHGAGRPNTNTPSPGMPANTWASEYASMAATSAPGMVATTITDMDQGGGMTELDLDYMSFSDLTGFGSIPSDMPPPMPHDLGDLQSQPMMPEGMPSSQLLPQDLPQDLFSIPMTLDWSFSGLGDGIFAVAENGGFDMMPSQ